MKAFVCLMCVVAAVAKPFQRGQFVLAYDNSIENGFMDTSLEWVRPIAGGGGAATRSFPQRTEDLQRMLDSGLMDRSDEMLLRAVMTNPERFGNRPYFVDQSGEVYFLPQGANGAGVSFGGAGASFGGTGVGAGSFGGTGAGAGSFGGTGAGAGSFGGSQSGSFTGSSVQGVKK